MNDEDDEEESDDAEVVEEEDDEDELPFWLPPMQSGDIFGLPFASRGRPGSSV